MLIEGYIINAYKYEEEISVQEGEWVLTGLFFSTSLILAANENGQLFGSETLIVVVALLLFFVPLFLYVRKLHSNMNDRSDRIIKENAALENLNKEINARNEEVNIRNEELDSLNRLLEEQIEQQKKDTGLYGSRMTIWHKPIVT